MATRGLKIPTDWTEVTAPLNMVDGKDYLIEVQGNGASVNAHDSQSAAAPDDSLGHVIWSTEADPSSVPMVFTKRAGWYWWLRKRSGFQAGIVVSEID